MLTLSDTPLDDWPPWDFWNFWAQVLKAPEMAPERAWPVSLVKLPLTRMLLAYEAGKWADDSA